MFRFDAVIGVDPGQQTGISVFHDGEYHVSTTLTPLETIKYLSELQGTTLVVIEDSRVQSYVFTGESLDEPEKLKVARNIGMVDMLCDLYVKVCIEDNCLVPTSQARDVRVVRVSPKTKGAKFKTNTALSKAVRSKVFTKNQHERDAYILAFMYRNANASHN